MSKKGRVLSSELGAIRIADEVVMIIAGIAAIKVDGVHAMSGGVAGDIAEVLGHRNMSKGVKVEIDKEEAAIDVYIIVKFGVRIPDVAWGIQENVKKAIEEMTGLNVIRVNIHIQGVNISPTKQEEGGEIIVK